MPNKPNRLFTVRLNAILSDCIKEMRRAECATEEQARELAHAWLNTADAAKELHGYDDSVGVGVTIILEGEEG